MRGNPSKKGKQSVYRAPSALDIIASFNTWAFKREQPDSAVRLATCAERAISLGEPVEFVTYWGKGPRSCFALPDATCLDFLEMMMRRVGEVHEAGARLHILMTDTHARLNCHSVEAIDRYYSDIAREGQARRFVCRRLSEVVSSDNPESSSDFDPAPQPLLDALTKSAAKWYRGDASPETVSLDYFRQNMREKKAVGSQYPNAIFLTFNNSNFRLLFPDKMPIFYMYSLKRGVSVKPWFIGEEEGTCKVWTRSTDSEVELQAVD